MADLTYTDGTGLHTVTGVIETSGIRLDNISEESEWDFITIDDSPNTVVTPHLGSTPNDRS
jgi:hypothetical protein